MKATGKKNWDLSQNFYHESNRKEKPGPNKHGKKSLGKDTTYG